MDDRVVAVAGLAAAVSACALLAATVYRPDPHVEPPAPLVRFLTSDSPALNRGRSVSTTGLSAGARRQKHALVTDDQTDTSGAVPPIRYPIGSRDAGP